MSEVQNHYAGQTGPRGPSRPATRPSGLAGTVKAKAGDALESVGDVYEQTTEWASDRYGSASRLVQDARRRSGDGLDSTRRQVTDFVEENPIMVGVVGLAAGLLLGSLLPGTRRENRVFGRYADEVRDQGMRYARDLAEQGKTFVEESLESIPRARADRDTGDESSAA